MTLSTAPLRVLLVDDSPANLVALGAVLHPLGVELIEARSGAEAIEKMALGSYAVVLLDVQMPGMDGFEAAARIRATDEGREVPIIFLTAIHRDEAFARRGYASGAADYITKPYDADIVRARVKAFTDLFRQRDDLRRRDVALRTRERDEAVRRLVAFERIATAALEEGDLTVLLRTLLGVFMEAADSADSATILLREDDVLRVRASVGRGVDPDGRTVPIGTGFAGTIASTGEPLHARGASDRSNGSAGGADSTGGAGSAGGADSAGSAGDIELRTRGIRGLFGVPMVHDGEIIGVTQIGSSRSGDFSPVEKRLLHAMAERASWAVAQRFRLNRFHTVLMSAPALVAILRGPGFACEFSNPAHRKFFGDGDVVGKTAAELGASPEILTMLAAVAATRQPLVIDEYPLTRDWRGDGESERRYVSFTVQPLPGQLRAVDELLWFGVDVTAQVLAREATEKAARERAVLLESERAARAEAEIANRAKDDFLATVSHELRTPLNAILGWTVVARRQAPQQLDRALGIIERNARAQARIIEDVLDVSRIVGGKLRLDVRPTDAAAVIESALETVRTDAETKGVILTSEVGAVGIISADADRVQQIVWNVLSNAIKFTPPGGTVDLAAVRLGARVVIRVTDTGEGIDPAFVPQIFEPFRQADGSTTRRHGGLGLGLAIVKQLVTAHGGTIRAESEGLDLGSTFTIELPARPSAAPPRTRSGPPSAAPPPRLDRVKVLVVDDEPDALSLVEAILSEAGAVVHSVSSAREALDLVPRLRPDVLVSDIGMPHVDGFGLLAQVRRLTPELGGRTPAIALTAHARSEDLRQATDAGFELAVMKPVDAALLLSSVARLVAGEATPAPTSVAGTQVAAAIGD